MIWAIFLKINLFPIYNNVAVRNGSVFTGNNHNYFLDIQEEVRVNDKHAWFPVSIYRHLTKSKPTPQDQIRFPTTWKYFLSLMKPICWFNNNQFHCGLIYRYKTNIQTSSQHLHAALFSKTNTVCTSAPCYSFSSQFRIDRLFALSFEAIRWLTTGIVDNP